MAGAKNTSSAPEPTSFGKTPAEFRSEAEAPAEEIVEREALDDPADPTVTPVEPRCAKCGKVCVTQAELLEHVKTCKGGHDQSTRAHNR